MKASDYIVEYLLKKDITDVFGYPGGMVTHLMDSFAKYQNKIKAHVTYHEQRAAFAACGYAQVSGKPGVAYYITFKDGSKKQLFYKQDFINYTTDLFVKLMLENKLFKQHNKRKKQY